MYIIKIIFIILLSILNNNKFYELLNIQINKFKMKEVQDLSLDEKLGQLFIIGFKTPSLTDEIRAMIREYKFGNFILFTRNIIDLEQLEKLTRDIHEEVINSTGIMPFIAIDQEGGNNIRIMHKSTFYPGPMTLSATDIINTKKVGHMMGKDLMALGINMNLAPSLDINNNPKNPIIGIRSFSDNPDMVSKYGIELIKGMQDEGIIATGKHFPGHGDVEIDSHLGLPILPFDKKRLYDMELKPFKKAIDNGVKNIMSAHIIFKEVDKENPATISKDIITGILRDELKYTGLITSDCMEMKAISNGITTPVGVVKGIKAGCDLVCICHTKKRQIDSLINLKKAIDEKFINMEEIDEKVKRILKYKNEVYPIMDKKFFKNVNNLEIFKNNIRQEEILQNIVDSSLTYVNGKKLEIKGKTLVYWCKQYASTKAEDTLNGDNFGDLLNKEIPSFETLEYKPNEYSKELIDKSKDYETVIFISFKAFSEQNQAKMINEINLICKNFFVISIRNPYDYLSLDKNINYYTLYESTPNSMRTIIKFLKGEIDAKGKLPITLAHI